MHNLRKYGQPPYRVAVIHGGPGAPGQMAPVARELAARRGVLEPLQTAATLEGQLEELRAVLAENASPPVTLIGWSWGAMLSFVFAAQQPEGVGKLILVGGAAFEERHAARITETRLARLDQAERREANSLMERLADPAAADKDAALARLGELFTRADTCDPLSLDTELLEAQYEVYQGVWRDAQALRASGELLELGRRIACPVLAIHGDHDPHPAEGVREPLARVVRDFRFVTLERCGHLPWLERHARREFFALLERELG